MIKASSLIESIIAIVLISICSLVALTVYLSVISQNNPIYYYEARHKVELLTSEAEQTQNFEEDTYLYETFQIEKTVRLESNNNVVILNFKIISGNKNYNIKRLISIENKI